jgi:transcriptional regulator with XRE-family HTH domain
MLVRGGFFMDLKGFGNYLRWFRKSNNWTQMEVANMIDCSLPTISKIENGEEFIGYRLFNRLNEIFEGFGMVYDEVHMEKIFKFKQARSELLHAIKNGRLKDIEKKESRVGPSGYRSRSYRSIASHGISPSCFR